MTIYRIVNWSDNFECNRTRELKYLSWVPVPNKLDGDGYTELASHENGAELYGAWIACVLVASRCDPRGTLLRDCKKPHDSASLARITRFPKETFDKLFRVAISIGWMETCDDPAPPCENPAGGCLERNGTERNRTEQNGTEQKDKQGLLYSPEFEEFWSAFPKGRKTGKGKAYEAFRKALRDTEPLVIIAGAVEYGTSQVGNGQYVKGPVPWLNQRCWEDDREAWGRQDENQVKTTQRQVQF